MSGHCNRHFASYTEIVFFTWILDCTEVTGFLWKLLFLFFYANKFSGSLLLQTYCLLCKIMQTSPFVCRCACDLLKGYLNVLKWSSVVKHVKCSSYLSLVAL